jgi:hypothetical protein
MNSAFERVVVKTVINGKEVRITIDSNKGNDKKTKRANWIKKLFKKMVEKKVELDKEEEEEQSSTTGGTTGGTSSIAGGGGIIFNPTPATPPQPTQDWTDFIGHPDLVLFGSDCFVDENNTLHTNWTTEAYPYNYAYIPDIDLTAFDAGDELTITIGRYTHPAELDTFGLLVSKWTGSKLNFFEEGYQLSTYNTYSFGYVNDGSDDTNDSILIMGVGTATKDIWEHYTITMKRSTSTISIYRDGVFKGSKVVAEFPPADTQSRVLFGANEGAQGAITPYRAKWRDIRFYNRILTDEEIATLSTNLDRS